MNILTEKKYIIVKTPIKDQGQRNNFVFLKCFVKYL